MRRSFAFMGTCLILLTSGCRREDSIQTYRVSKESESSMPPGQAAMPMAQGPMSGDEPAAPAESGAGPDMQSMGAGLGMTAAASPKEIEWKVPSGWKEQAPSAMRVGSFLVTGSNGQTADMSVVPLSGMAGGNLANINRWREQINLAPISEADLPGRIQKITPGGRPMLLIDFVSQELMLGNRYKKRLLAAILTRGERTWFFKMMGEDSTVENAKPAFLQFLKNLKFHDNA